MCAEASQKLGLGGLHQMHMEGSWSVVANSTILDEFGAS